MSTLNRNQTMLLRSALGLSFYTTVPTRNWLPQCVAEKYPEDVEELVRLGYLTRRQIVGQSIEEDIEITDAGRALVLPT